MNAAGEPLSRRAVLKSLAVAAASLSLPQLAVSAPNSVEFRLRVKAYLGTCSRPDGGYAWSSEAESHLTSTFGAIGCYHVLRKDPPGKASTTEFVRRHHPSALKKLEQEHREFEFQQIQSLVWLGEDASSFRKQVAAWERPMAYLKRYEQHGWPIFSHEILSSFHARALLGLPLNDIPEHIHYLDSRRRKNGSFNSTPSESGGDGNVLNTWYGLQALELLGRVDEKKEETITWLRDCQMAGGGFTHQPRPEFAPVDDVAYTWAAVRALTLLGATPANPGATLAYIASLANPDGGFADKPGWSSNPLATYYALDTLATLDQLDSFPLRSRHARPVKSALPRGLKVFSIQIEAHGNGSPADAVELARSLSIHLWGAKNTKPEWLGRAQAIADTRKVGVKFFVANEEYGTWVNVPGLGTYSHSSDLIVPAGRDFGTSLASRGVVSWAEFREQRLGPLQRVGGRLIWQFGENEELVRLYLDDSAQRGGYSAISTFHFGNPDFTNTEPFLQRYRGRIPFVALQDAHGKEPWWFADMTSGFRTLFLAAEPTWEGWLKALENNWVIAVRHDGVSGFKTWMHGGSDQVLGFVRLHELDWRWWDNPTISRPMFSFVALTPEDKFEAGRPERGIALRVRCAYENTAHGAPTRPLAELTRLVLDGVEVDPEKSGEREDPYYFFRVPAPKPGKHTATATILTLATGRSSRQTIEF